ncbi:hypothetical protein [Devosia sp.]|uniref:hypothetical protein n=1 Tax=Devosia sp. TaxID=1871048 RepID=UPI001B08A185|nr:hypothetical protein [Devosia sp.]MBO9587726.1 hypothetical protein [Devosia sp.]
MTSFIVSTINCPHCGHTNSVTTDSLPLGTVLGCSMCHREVAQWHGGSVGFRLTLIAEVDPAPAEKLETAL